MWPQGLTAECGHGLTTKLVPLTQVPAILHQWACSGEINLLTL